MAHVSTRWSGKRKRKRKEQNAANRISEAIRRNGANSEMLKLSPNATIWEREWSLSVTVIVIVSQWHPYRRAWWFPSQIIVLLSEILNFASSIPLLNVIEFLFRISILNARVFLKSRSMSLFFRDARFLKLTLRTLRVCHLATRVLISGVFFFDFSRSWIFHICFYFWLEFINQATNYSNELITRLDYRRVEFENTKFLSKCA